MDGQGIVVYCFFGKGKYGVVIQCGGVCQCVVSGGEQFVIYCGICGCIIGVQCE